MMTNLEIIRALYDAFHQKDYDHCRRLMAADIEWIQNPGFPGGGHHHGVEAVIAHVFKSFAGEWDGFGYQAAEYLDAGETITVLGKYVGRHLKTGKALEAIAAHVYDLKDGKITRFRQYTDTYMIVQATQA